MRMVFAWKDCCVFYTSFYHISGEANTISFMPRISAQLPYGSGRCALRLCDFKTCWGIVAVRGKSRKDRNGEVWHMNLCVICWCIGKKSVRPSTILVVPMNSWCRLCVGIHRFEKKLLRILTNLRLVSALSHGWTVNCYLSPLTMYKQWCSLTNGLPVSFPVKIKRL